MMLRTRLLIAQLPIAVSLAVIGVLAVLTVGDLGRAGQDILSANYRSVLAAQRMKESLERIDSATLFIVAGEREKGLAQLQQHQPQFEAELKIQEGNLTEQGEAAATGRLRQQWTAYLAQLEELARSDRPKEHYLSRLEPAFFGVKGAADVILTLNQDAMVHKSERLRRDSRRVNTIMVAGVLLSLVVGLGFSLNLTDRALRPLGVLGQAVRRLGEGDLAVRAAMHGPSDLDQLGREFNAMAARLQTYRDSSLGELLQAQQASQAAIDSLPDPVLVFGQDGALLNLNR
ncbi:MAG: sensory box histidine kinase, partial [Myxococcaceae bacterium]|nr:sensory box histidine kinase [Myxococcaceae bacterium]